MASETPFILIANHILKDVANKNSMPANLSLHSSFDIRCSIFDILFL